MSLRVMVSVNAFLSAFLHLFLRVKGAVLKASLVKLFCFFFLATLAIPPPPPAQYLSWGLSYITAGKWIYFAPAPQNHVNEIMQ